MERGEGRGDKEGEGRALWACDGVVKRAESNELPMGGAYERDGAGLVHGNKVLPSASTKARQFRGRQRRRRKATARAPPGSQRTGGPGRPEPHT
jgi:hypothetical protein